MAAYRVRKAKTADVDSIARLHVEAWESAYRGLLPYTAFETRTLERRRSQWAQLLEVCSDWIVLVATDSRDEIQGFASARKFKEPDSGYESYLGALYLRPMSKGRGLGRTLITEVARRLLDTGAHNMALRTLRLNPARGFYERLGARLVPAGIATEAGEFDDVVYGFDDLERLAAI